MLNVVLQKLGIFPLQVHAQTAPTWSSSTTDTVITNLTDSLSTQLVFLWDTISGYVLPVIVIALIFGIIFQLFRRWRR